MGFWFVTLPVRISNLFFFLICLMTWLCTFFLKQSCPQRWQMSLQEARELFISDSEGNYDVDTCNAICMPPPNTKGNPCSSDDDEPIIRIWKAFSWQVLRILKSASGESSILTSYNKGTSNKLRALLMTSLCDYWIFSLLGFFDFNVTYLNNFNWDLDFLE